MRTFIEILNEGLLPDRNRIEIIMTEAVENILEEFKDPENDLTISVREVYDDVNNGKLYLEAKINEKINDTPIIHIDYVLGSNTVNFTNVVSYRDDKPVNTSAGLQTGGADMGRAAMKWIYKAITSDAENRGYHNVKITSSTRYTGARAYNGPKTTTDEVPKNYDVNLKLRERIIYTLKDGLVFVKE